MSVFGIFSKQQQIDVASEAYMALFALQHRGQQSCGIAVNDDGVIKSYRDMGLVPETFNPELLASKLGLGNMAIGHVEYSKYANGSRADAQPLVVRHIKGTMALASSGTLVNVPELREELELNGAIFHSSTDAEIISHVIIKERLSAKSIEAAVEQAMFRLKGSYSLIIMSPQKLIAALEDISS